MVAGLRSLALTNKLLRLLDRRKATRGLALKTLLQRGDEDKMLKCLFIAQAHSRVKMMKLKAGTNNLIKRRAMDQ